jgi:uncharacterized LabA/DUF88 family protein
MSPFRRRKKPVKKLANYAFIDNQNLNLGVRKFGWKMDWRKFRAFLRDKYNVEKAFMFIGYMQENEELYTQMHEAGYLVVLKPMVGMFNEQKTDEEKPKTDEKEEKKAPKGNVDTDLVLHVMKEWPNYDKAIIVSGDGDFFSVIEYLDEKGKLLHIMAPNWMYSSLLKPFDKYVVRIDQHKRELAYYSHKHKKPADKQS